MIGDELLDGPLIVHVQVGVVQRRFDGAMPAGVLLLLGIGPRSSEPGVDRVPERVERDPVGRIAAVAYARGNRGVLHAGVDRLHRPSLVGDHVRRVRCPLLRREQDFHQLPRHGDDEWLSGVIRLVIGDGDYAALEVDLRPRQPEHVLQPQLVRERGDQDRESYMIGRVFGPSLDVCGLHDHRAAPAWCPRTSGKRVECDARHRAMLSLKREPIELAHRRQIVIPRALGAASRAHPVIPFTEPDRIEDRIVEPEIVKRRVLVWLGRILAGRAGPPEAQDDRQ